MAELSAAERQRIYEEEKTRIDARAQIHQERRAPLEHAIERYIRDGFRLIVRTDTTAQLIKPRRYEPIFGILGFLTFGVFWVIGLLLFLTQKDQIVDLSLDASGQVVVKTPESIQRSELAADPARAEMRARGFDIE